jgi:hypothetical protein
VKWFVLAVLGLLSGWAILIGYYGLTPSQADCITEPVCIQITPMGECLEAVDVARDPARCQEWRKR